MIGVRMDIGCQRVRYCVFYDVTRGLHLIKITYDCNYRRIEVKRLNQSRQVRCRNFFIYVNLCYRINGVTQRLIVVFEVWFNVELFSDILPCLEAREEEEEEIEL